MLHFENIPLWFWPVLALIGLFFIGIWLVEHIRMRRMDRDMRNYRARAKGEEMAWKLRWRPRPRRLTYRDDKK